MRVLITITAILAYAAAAPSGAFIAPLAPVAPLVAIPAAIPTLSPGDLQAAAINAKVQAEDQARAFADAAREQAEQALENQKEKVAETIDEVKEKTEDGFWEGEDKKWQALDAVNIAQAKLQGSVANIEGAVANFEGAVAANAPELAKSALSGAYIAANVPELAKSPLSGAFIAANAAELAKSPLSGAYILPLAPYPAPIVYAAPGYVAPVAKITPSDAVNQINNPEPPKADEKKETFELKAAETPKENESPAKKDEEKLIGFAGPLPLVAGKVEPWIAPVTFVNPGIPTFAATPLAAAPLVPGQILAPAFLKY